MYMYGAIDWGVYEFSEGKSPLHGYRTPVFFGAHVVNPHTVIARDFNSVVAA